MFGKKAKNEAVALGSREAEIRVAFTQLADSTNFNKKDQIELIIKSADEGSVLAQTLLGFCYEKGLGVKENKKSAVSFYRSAAQRGNESAYFSLVRMYDELRPSDDEFKIYDAGQ